MPLLRHHLTLRTRDAIEFIDITDPIAAWVRLTGIQHGLLSVMSPHTTARIHLNELDPALQRDMQDFLRKLVPPDAAYAHNADTVDGRDNAHAHLMGLLVNATETVPVQAGALELGRWQRVFLVELDGPREQRTVALHLWSAD